MDNDFRLEGYLKGRLENDPACWRPDKTSEIEKKLADLAELQKMIDVVTERDTIVETVADELEYLSRKLYGGSGIEKHHSMAAKLREYGATHNT